MRLSLFLLTISALYGADAVLVGDATTRASAPTVNFGTAQQLEVSNGVRSFLQFDFSSLPAGVRGNNIGSAVLRMYVNRVTAPGTMVIATAVATWAEGTITDVTAPGAAVITSANVIAPNQFISVDVTALVQQWVDSPALNRGFVLSTSTGSFLLDAKESTTTSQPARLTVELVSVGPQGPKGDTGAQGAQGVPGPTGPAGPNVLQQGTAAAPSLSFAGDTGTGLYSAGTGNVNIATGGQKRLSIGSTGNVDFTGDLTLGGLPLAKLTNSGSSLTTSFGLGTLASNTGGGNSAFGTAAMVANTIGVSNTGVGAQALVTNTTGSLNTAVGAAALRSVNGTGNIAIGADSGRNLSSGNYNVYISNTGAASESGTIRIGDSNHKAVYMAGVRGVTAATDATPVVVDSNGQLGTNFTMANLFTTVRVDYSLQTNALVNLGMSCPADHPVLVSGGCGYPFYTASALDIDIRYNGPDPAGAAAWRCLIQNTGSTTRAVVGFAICAK